MHGFSAAALSLLWVVATVSGACAHDYWLEQRPWSVSPGDECTVHLLVGDELSAELERPLQRNLTTRYEWHTATETLKLATMPDSTLPVFKRAMTTPGLSLLVMDRNFVSIESTVRGFREFLENEEQQGLGAPYEGVNGETPLSRRYARSIKSLIRVGTPDSSSLHQKTVGQAVEIRIMEPPHALALGDHFTVHVAFNGVDLTSHLVKAFAKEEDGTVTTQKRTTNDQGEATFALDRAGLWMIRVAHLRQCNDCGVDWDTHYATFCFVYP